MNFTRLVALIYDRSPNDLWIFKLFVNCIETSVDFTILLHIVKLFDEGFVILGGGLIRWIGGIKVNDGIFEEQSFFSLTK